VTRPTRSLALLALALRLVLPSPARAAVDLVGSRSIGMGGALIAAGTGETAVLLNPAALPLRQSYIISGLYEYRVSDGASLLNASIADSSTSKLAAGLAYSFAHSSPSWLVSLGGGKTFPLSETIDSHEVALALAYPLFNMAAIGVTTRYINHKVTVPEDTPTALVEEDLSTVSLDIGGEITLLGSLQIGVVGYNIAPTHNAAYPTRLGIGISYTFGSRFLLEFDPVLDFTSADSMKPSYHAGGELSIIEYLTLRAGFMYSTLRTASYASGGASVNLKKFSFDFGLRQMVKGGAETLIALSIRLSLE
jgi:hypothetical protein